MKKHFLLTSALLLLALAPLSAQRASENYPFLSYWDFKYRGTPDSVDCRFNTKNKELFLSGFDTDGEGTFYFAGGSPLRVSCFKGTTLQWRREVSDTHTTRALFRLRGDSLYLVHDRTCELIILSKDGTGDVQRVKLPTDDINQGVMHKNYFVVRNAGVVDPRFKIGFGWEHVQFKVSFFNYRGELAWTDEVGRELTLKMMRPMPVLPISDKNMYRGASQENDYMGVFRNLHLFVGEGSQQFMLTSLGDIQYSCKIDKCGYYSIFSILPMHVLNDEIDKEVHLPSPEGQILRGTHFYYVGYEYETGDNLIVVDIDLDTMFPEAAEWIRKDFN